MFYASFYLTSSINLFNGSLKDINTDLFFVGNVCQLLKNWQLEYCDRYKNITYSLRRDLVHYFRSITICKCQYDHWILISKMPSFCFWRIFVISMCFNDLSDILLFIHQFDYFLSVITNLLLKLFIKGVFTSLICVVVVSMLWM